MYHIGFWHILTKIVHYFQRNGETEICETYSNLLFSLDQIAQIENYWYKKSIN